MATLLMQMVRAPAPELVHIDTDDAGRPYLRLRSEYSGTIESIDLLIASERHRRDQEFTWKTLNDLAAEDSPPRVKVAPYCINPDHDRTELPALLFDPRSWTAVAQITSSHFDVEMSGEFTNATLYLSEDHRLWIVVTETQNLDVGVNDTTYRQLRSEEVRGWLREADILDWEAVAATLPDMVTKPAIEPAGSPTPPSQDEASRHVPVDAELQARQMISLANAWSRRLSVSSDQSIVTLDGEPYSVSEDSAAVFATMLEAYPDHIAAGAYNSKPQRLVEKWPDKLRAILHRSNTGYRLKHLSGRPDDERSNDRA